MTFLYVAILSIFLTFIFDFLIFKIKQKHEINIAWRAVNDQLEREGKQRWDRK